MPIYKQILNALGLGSERRSGMFGDPTTPMTARAVWEEFDAGGPTAAGEMVTDRTAMQVSTVYTCVTILSEAVASLPCALTRTTAQGDQKATDHYLWPLLAYAPNEEMTAFTFWSTMVGCSALRGNGYAQITRDPDGTPNGFWPLHPNKTKPVRLKNGRLAYSTTDGMQAGAYRIIRSADMLHFPLFALDGINGISPVQAARESVALALAAEKHGARFFGNGARASVVFINKNSKPDPKAQQELKESWQQAYGGANVHKQPFFFGDWDVKTIGISPEDSQFLATRNFQRADIAAMFHLNPHQVGDTSRMSSGNHVQAQLTFVTETLRPILTRIETELYRKLLAPSFATRNLSVVFDLTTRLRGDMQTQMQAYALGRQWGFLSVNEVRQNMGLNPIGPEGDTYLYPVNMANAEQLLKDQDFMPNTELPVKELGAGGEPEGQTELNPVSEPENPQNPPKKKKKP